MKMNTFVYTHPINMYIIQHLGIPVDTFCSLYDIKQGTISSWITRDKKVETLPVNFIYCLSLASSRPMDYVYDQLLNYQEGYQTTKRKKRRIDSNQPEKERSHEKGKKGLSADNTHDSNNKKYSTRSTGKRS